MLTLAWHVNSMNGKPYPVLWYGDIPTKETAGSHYIIKQQTRLTDAETDEVFAQPEGTRTAYVAKKYPYNDPDPVDTAAKVTIVTEHTTEIVTRTETIEA